MGDAMRRGDEDPEVYLYDRYGGRSQVGDVRLDWQPETMEEAETDVSHPVVEFLPPAEAAGRIGLWEKVQTQQAANRKMQRKYNTVKGDLRVANERAAAAEQRLATISRELEALRLKARGEIIDRAPDVIVLDADFAPPLDPTSPIEEQDYLADLAKMTGAVVIAVPGGNLQALTTAEAKEALKFVISRSEVGQ